MTQRRITSFFAPVSSTGEEDPAESADVAAETGERDVEEGLSTTTKLSKRKRSAKGDTGGEPERESTKKRRKVDVQQKSVEKMVVSDPVPFEKLDEPGPSGVQVPTLSPAISPSRRSDDNSPLSGLELCLGSGSSPSTGTPSLTKDWHPPSPMHGRRETAPREHAMELRPGIVKKLHDTIQQTIETRLQRVKEERDAQEETEAEKSTPPESTNVWIEARRPSSIDSSLPSTTSTVGSRTCSLSVLSSGPVGIHISEMQIDSPDISRTTITPVAPTNPESVSVQESKMEIDSPDTSRTNVTPVPPICPGPSLLLPKDAEDIEVDYNPAQSGYHPVNSAIWNYSCRIPYFALAKTMYCIEQESSRLKITEILANFFRSAIILSRDDLLPSVYLCLNKLAPAYEDLELGFAETSLMKAIAECTGRSLAQIKADNAVLGDLGIVAEKSRMKQNTMFRSNELTISGVYSKLVEIAKMAGRASMKQKTSKVINLFVCCRGIEARYLVRSLLGKLRIGLAEQSVLQALAVACTRTPLQQDYPPKIMDFSKTCPENYKSQLERNALVIKTAYCEYPDYGKLITVLLEDGIDGLPKRCHLTAGIPLKPMLAQPTKGIKEIFQRFENFVFTCEWKYDGERAQIHMTENGEVSIYSRNQENNTSKYPDIVTIVQKAVKGGVTSYIIDCEAVAWDSEQQQILPFQILSTRKRKNTAASEIKVQVCIFAFDLLLLNNEPLVKKPLCERRALLRDMFTPIHGEFQFAISMDTNTMDEVQSFLDDAIKGRCEGLMVKTLEQEATYEIAKRSRNWLKLKKDYLDGMGDSLDVVVLGGYRGQGKRAGLYGGFLLACYDPNAEEFQSLCKIGTGFSDEDLANHTEFFMKHRIPQPRPYYRYDKSHTPDDWFDAVQVWEIKGADLTLSPTHWAAKGLCGSDQRGISLRFPRFLRIRDDKAVADATSSEQIAQMYMSQAQIESSGSALRNIEEDFY
ncbi:DNA ligase 1 isoform X2 [Anabrus simplex]|uniref:DNA ligase 1 isoform X2 n=1 Tax=Anabrus simplex TaxID=316456 RepID=UPI0035A37D4A